MLGKGVGVTTDANGIGTCCSGQAVTVFLGFPLQLMLCGSHSVALGGDIEGPGSSCSRRAVDVCLGSLLWLTVQLSWCCYKQRH